MKVIMQSLATANPVRYVHQEETYKVLSGYFEMGQAERQLYQKILLEGPIRGRYLGIAQDEQVLELSADALLERFLTNAREMGRKAGAEAIEAAGLLSSEVGGLVVNTCTGYLCPGLSSYLAQDLGLGGDVRVVDIMGMGCGAAIPNLETAAGLLALHPERPILCVALEVCSATMVMGDAPDLVVSNSIFGDGAGALILAPEEGQSSLEADRPLLRLVDFETGVFPRHREQLRYRTEEGRLRNVLGRRVPILAARSIREVGLRLLRRHGLAPEEIEHWIVHPGGTLVLDEVARVFELPNHQLRHSYAIFQEYGNMSSPSILFVLRRILQEDKPDTGDKALLLAFGAGFTAFAALAEFV